MRWRNYYWPIYSPSKPIQVEGGIKTKSRKGSIGDTWWSKRWVSVLESFGWSNRLERGRRYARNGQVLNFNLNIGQVTAKVQGSVPTPYSVSIKLKPFPDKEWDKVFEMMAQKAIFIAKLLAGEMPQNIEEAFIEAGMTLFPKSAKDLETSCSCPDIANPCKHVAAVYYILAEEFDRDPFMLLKLRGKERETLITTLRQRRILHAENSSDNQIQSTTTVPEQIISLPLTDFWSEGALESFSVTLSPPNVPAAIIKRLGTPPFWDSKKDFYKLMKKYYEKISNQVLKIAYE